MKADRRDLLKLGGLAITGAALAPGAARPAAEARRRRDDRRKIVLSMPEYVAGLQFDTVFVGGLEARFARYGANQGYELRRFLSSLYLGASRAARQLEMHFTDAGGAAPAVIESAISSGSLTLSDGA
jgi:hypothetical protein